MRQDPTQIFNEYRQGCNYKASLGSKGMVEQNRINERFYIGDQWHGAKCGNDRPLVRHNVVKRVGDYKMSQILYDSPKLTFSAEGIPSLSESQVDDKLLDPSFSGAVSESEINFIMSAFENYYNVTAERVKLSELHEKVLRNSYICGTSVLYTYWDGDIPTGLFADREKRISINGDICCEVLDIDDIVFGDPYCEAVQNQPFIIISSRKESAEVLREARLYGADIGVLKTIAECEEDGKISVLTKLFKEYVNGEGYKIKCVKVCEKAVVRKEFDTGLGLYPLSCFYWERKSNSAYGESEITYLIPNQIAINRMITANVWSAMIAGMPIMVVNGDTVTDKITNEPGQIIKVFGSNEDVAGAVNYITPPSTLKDFDSNVSTLINNTLTQSGANEVALGDSRADNATALMTMRNAAIMPLKMIKNRFYTFIEDTARIWADFWIACYGKRALKQKDKSGSRYIPFDGSRYKSLVFYANVNTDNTALLSDKERAEMLISLFEKGIISRRQLLSRLPEGLIEDIPSLIGEEIKEAEK